MLSDGLFTALLLLINGVSVETVPSPTNVNVNCHNVKVTVSWEYSNEQPQTVFHVKIIDSTKVHGQWNTTEHQYDLTNYIWTTQDRFMELYHVKVSAIQGEKESGAVTSQTFSFNNLKTTSIQCILEFPPVKLNEESSSVATLHLMNPYHRYKELKQASKSNSASFEIKVTSDDGDQCFYCSAKEKNCEHTVTFSEGVKKCVTLKGFLGINNIGVQFNKTGPICVTESAETHVITLVVLLCVVVFILAVVVIGICKVRAWTMDTPLPNSLRPNRREQDLNYDRVPVVEVTVGPCHGSSDSSFEYSPGEERGFSDSRDQDLEAAASSEGQRTDDDSVKTECVSMDSEEEEEPSPYDCPHNVQVDMGSGDIVTGYTGN